MEPTTAARLQQMLSQLSRNSLFAMLFRPPRLDSSSQQEQQAAAAAAERGSSSSPAEQQGLVQYAVAPAAVAATRSGDVSSADVSLARVQGVSSAGAGSPATIPRGSLEGQSSAELELAAGAALHNVRQQQQQQQQVQ
jgi:hypothetical protein